MVVRLLKQFRELAAKHKEPLLKALFVATQFRVLQPSSTTEKQYVFYLRVLCYTVNYTSVILKMMGVRSVQFLESMAACVMQILVYYPKQTVGADDGCHVDGAAQPAGLQHRGALRPRVRPGGVPAVAADPPQRRRAV